MLKMLNTELSYDPEISLLEYIYPREMKTCISSVQSLSHVQLFVTPWIAACQASLSITNSWSSLRLTSIESVMPSIQPSHPLSSPSPPAPNPSQDQSLLQWVNSYMRWPKYWSLSFSISPSNEHPGLISFRMDWLDLLAVQGTLKSLLQHHSSKASIYIDPYKNFYTNVYAAAAAKSLQSCPTLCDPTDGSPPGSPDSGILQARTLEWGAISFSNAWKWKVKVKTLSRVRLFATPWTAAHQAPPSMGFSRQEYWSGVPLPSPTNVYSGIYISPKVEILKMSINRWRDK